MIALGPSSHALLANHTWANPAPLEHWIQAYQDGNTPPATREVPEPEARFEWIFLNLRLVSGLSLDRFEEEWGVSIVALHGEAIDRLVDGGLLEMDRGWLKLTPGARFVSDVVFSEFAPAS